MLLALATASAADRPNFSGTWTLNRQKSDFGPLPAPAAYERKVVHDEPLIQMSVHQASALGEQTVESVIRTDGHETTNPSRNGETHTIGKWSGDALEVTTRRTVEGGEAVTKEVWTLSADGRELTSEANLTTPRGEFHIHMVLEKR